MKNLPLQLPLMKEYAIFIQNNFLNEYIQEVIINYKNLNVPLLKLFAHLSEEQIFEISRQSLNEFLTQFGTETAIKEAEIAIENWKADKLPGVSRKDIKASDIVLINNARKIALVKFLHEFKKDTKDIYPLIKEIEDYYTYTHGLAMEAFAQIKQEEIISREKRLKEAQSLAHVGNWEYNPKNKFVEWSEELYRIYQFENFKVITPEEVIKYIIPEDYPKVQQLVKLAARQSGSYKVEYRIIRNDGEIRYLLENGFVEKDSEGDLVYRGTVQDITSLKKIENELRKSEKNFRLLAENSTDIISKHALDGTINYISPSCFPITGYTPDELTGKIAFDYYHPDDLKIMGKAYDEVSQIPDSTIATFRFRKKDGKFIWFESLGKTIKDPDGIPYEITATNRDITERKEAEDRLKRHEELLTGVLNSTLSGIQVFKAIKDEKNNVLDFQWVMVNNAALNRWGLSRENVIGRNLTELFPGVKQSGIFEKNLQAFRGEILNYKQYYNTDKLNHWFNIVAMPYGDGIIVSTDDITAQVIAEEELKKINLALEEKIKKRTSQLEKQKENIYSVFMQAPAMIAILRGPDFVFELANPLYLQVIGKTSDIIGKPILEVLPEIKDQPVYNIINKVYHTGKRSIGNEVLMALDIHGTGKKENLYFNFVYEPLRNSDGNVDGFLTHAVDVTRQVEARKQLEESEDRFRSMADNIPNLAWMGEPDGSIFWYNKRWYEYTGTTPETVKGWGWQSVQHPDDLPKVMERWQKSIATGEFFEMVFSLKGKDGIFRPFLTRIIPIHDNEGIIVRWFGTNTDITEHIQAEESLERKNKELIRINNDLDNFIYTASHDLKSPVSNLEGLLNMMADDNEALITENGKSVLPLVEKSLSRLKTVIHELTEIAKIQKETQSQQEVIILNNFFREILDSFNVELKNYKGKMEYDFSKAPEIKFSRKNLRSILFNLISNSLKYADPLKLGYIKITTRIQDEFLLMKIEDNGLGIPEKQMDRIFTMFKRYHTHVEGSGVGLYIVKRIVENAGGKIAVESEVGIGTRFNLFFPILND